MMTTSDPVAATEPGTGQPAGAQPAADESADESTAERPLEDVELELSTLAAQLASATCRFLQLVAEFDARQGWSQVHGIVSTAQWLSWRCGLSAGTAREQVRVARALADLPEITAAFAAGQLSYSKVRAISRVATAETEHDLLQIAEAATANQLDRFCAGVRTASTVEGVNERHSDRRLTFRTEWDGSVAFSGRCSPEDGAVIVEALRRVQDQVEAGTAHTSDSPAPPGEESKVAAGRALIDALVLLCEHGVLGPAVSVENLESIDAADTVDAPEVDSSGDTGPIDTGQSEDPCASTGPRMPGVARGSRRSETILHVTLDDLAETRVAPAETSANRRLIGPRLEFGPALHPETARRLTCDTGVVLHIHEAEQAPPADPPRRVRRAMQRFRVTPSARPGRTVDLGRRRRTPSAAQFRALWERDQGCRFPGCERRRYLHAHHIIHWADGGPTDLDNLVLLCGEHHRLLHEGGFVIIADADGELTFQSPDGVVLEPVPAPPTVDLGAALPLAFARPVPAGDGPHPLAPVGGGSRLDLDYALSTVMGNWDIARRRAERDRSGPDSAHNSECAA